MDKNIPDVIEHVFAILDSKSNVFGPPFCAKSNGDAIRSFDQLVNDMSNNRSLISQFPADFFLYRIGSYNLSKGLLVPAIVESLGVGTDFKREVKNGNVVG